MNVFTWAHGRVSAHAVAVFTVISMILSAFPASFFVAHAATTVTGPDSATFESGGDTSFETTAADATVVDIIRLNFDFDGTTADNNDSVEFGWKRTSDSTENTLGMIDFKNGQPNPADIGSISAVLPGSALVSDLIAYIKVFDGFDADDDKAEFTAIELVGESAPEGTRNTRETAYDSPDGKIDFICHYDDSTSEYQQNPPNLSSIVKDQGHGDHDMDIIPPFWFQFDNEDPVDLYPGKNWDEAGKAIYDDECALPPVKTSETIVITGDTWNVLTEYFTGTGWVFGSSPAPGLVPTTFTTDAQSIGAGSFFGGPIAGAAANKIIAALQIFTPVADFESFSYDFNIASNAASDANEFYLNVYANFGSSDPSKFYDCRYDIVPTVGTVGSFVTVTFDKDDTGELAEEAINGTCPATIAEMETEDPGSIIRAFALNIGDTAAQDAGVSGYFDNVVLDTATKITTYDFEPESTDDVPPTITIKEDSLTCEGGFELISFKLFDEGLIDKVEINGVEKDLTDNKWSDVNFVEPGVFGAVSGTNTIIAYDVAGNTAELEFFLCDKAQQCVNLLVNGSFEDPEVTNKSLWQKFASVAGWVIEKVSDDSSTTLEIMRGWSGNDAANGEQYVELDGDHSTKISQTVETLEGGEYELKWAFAPRHGIAAEQNQLAVLVDDSLVATEGPATGSKGLEVSDWTVNSYVFEATGEDTTITFSDAGPSNSFGTFLDDAVLCLVQEPEPEPEEPEICSLEGVVTDYSDPVFKNNGNPVDTDRRNVSALETVADYSNFFGKEPSWSTDDFFTLGIEGYVIYEFTDKVAVDQPGADIAIWEITGGNSGLTGEKAEVWVSEDGIDFKYLETVTGDAEVDIAPAGLSYVRFVKLIDDSDGVQGGNGDGFDLDAITIIEGSCDDYEAPMCSLEAVSDTGTVIVENNEFAVDTYEHNNWTASIPGASWVWETYLVLNPLQEETKTFKETFIVNGVTTAFLDVAADNAYKIFINGNLFHDENDGDNFTSVGQKQFDVASELVNGENTLEIEVTNYTGNSDPTKNPAGVLYKLVVDAETQCKITTELEPDVPEYGPYCGDGVVNGSWEQCEIGEQGCTDHCLFDNQCSMEQLVKITLDESVQESVSFDQTIHLGASGDMIPSGTWFNFNEIGDDAVNTIANGIDGLAVERTDTELRLAVKGGNSGSEFDYVFGNIMSLGIDFGAVDKQPVPGWPLETTGGYPDVFDKQPDNSIDFKFWLTNGDDSVAVEVQEGEEYNCPECKATVEARVLLNDSGTAGNGDLSDEIILGDDSYTTVAFGEWFPISLAPAPGESAVMISDPNTVTNFDSPATKPGLFVSREDGTVKVALYGEMSPGGNTNYEWVDARIEVRDAEISNYMEMTGAFKFENHSENDNVPSNDGADTATADDTGVDFRMWVDTGSDGFKFDIAHDDIASCDDDTEPEVDTYPVKGDVYDVTGVGAVLLPFWTVYASSSDMILSTTTDANGRYAFDLPAGEWNVYQGLPSGWEQESISQDGTVSNDPQCEFVFGVEGKTDSPITSTGGYNYCDFYNERELDDEEMLNRVDGYKIEVTENGTSTVAGWTIFASNGIDTPLSTTTDSTGYYYFDLPAGEWEISELLPLDWNQVSVEQNGDPLEGDGFLSCTFIYDEYQIAFAQDEYFYGDSCDFFNERISEDSDSEDTIERRGSSGTQVTSRAGATELVAGVSTSFCPFIEDYMQIGIANDSWEVTKLQMFLSIVMGYTQPVTGVFDQTTDENVKLFQERYKSDVLSPWFELGIVPHDRPTGFVYKLTRWKINDIVCPGWEAYPSFDGEDLNSNIDID